MCLFCKIIANEIPNYTVWENENVLAFLDIHPCSKGHTVVIPKKHFEKLDQMNQEEYSGLMQGVSEAMKKLQNVLKPEGMNVGINNGEAAGQAVLHVHWHILPRYHNDGGGSMHSIIRDKNAGDVAALAESFK